MGMMGGSFGLWRGGCYCCSTNYQRPLLAALLPSAATTSTSLSLSPPTRHRPFKLKDKNKITITKNPATLLLSTFPDANYAGIDANYSREISAFSPTASPISRTFFGWKCCFCTTPSSSSAAASMDEKEKAPKGDENEEDEMTKIKETANTLDIRVGKILRAWRHEEADSLFVEEVDVGEPEPRIICSGLVKYVPLDHLQGSNVVVLANLKPRNMRGVKSSGMLMAALDELHENVELLVPPEGSVPGQRIWFGSVDEKENLPDAASPNQIQKKKIWELVQPHLRTDESCIAALGMHTMRTTEGVVVCRSLKNARIS